MFRAERGEGVRGVFSWRAGQKTSGKSLFLKKK